MKILIETAYTATGSAAIELPDGKSWDDVEYYYVRHDLLHIRFKGDAEDREYELHTDAHNIDWKYPDYTKVWLADADGECDFEDNKLLDEVQQ